VPALCAAQDAAELARAGTTAIEKYRFGDALRAFTRAAHLRPGDATLPFGAGVAAFMLGQDDVAKARFEAALTLNPAFLPAATWLADLHYRTGRLTDAIAMLEAARARVPLTSDLQQQLDEWRSEQTLQSRFHEARSPHFTVLFEASSDEPLARDVLERLEKAYVRVGRALGVHPSSAIAVVFYTRQQFADITRLAPWSVAAYDGRIRVPLAGTVQVPEELDRLLSHELVHAIVAGLGGRTVPAWVNEGLATALEPAGTASIEAALAETQDRPALAALHRGFGGLASRDAEIAYASAARAVRRLMERRGAPALVALLGDLSRGETFDRAFHRRIEMRYEDFAALVARD
jgi:tetratricopeptide (TPR) repeat protein